MKLVCAWVAVMISLMAAAGATAAPQASASPTSAPTLVRLDGQLKTPAGEVRTGSVTLVVSLYAERDDTTPLWVEPQTVTLDTTGRYTVFAGATLSDGVPQEFLSGAEAGRWLGVGVQGEPEQFRLMLVTVPYALKAREADTLAGKTLSDFVLTENLTDTVKSSLKSQLGGASSTSSTGPGTASVSTADAFQLSGTQAVVNPGMFYGTTAAAVIFSGGPGGFQFNNTANTAALMNLTNGGNLGLGTISPTRALHLFGATPELGIESSQPGGRLWTLQSNGTGIIPSTFQLIDRTAGAARLAIDNSGNVGIGTTAPSRPLHVRGATPELGLESTQPGGGLWTLQSNGTGVVPATFQIIDRTAGAARVGIDSAGNVGIGTTSPATRLHIANASSSGAGLFVEASEGDRTAMYYSPNTGVVFDSFRPGDGRRLPVLLQPNGGNVGIGTTAPVEKLHVVKSGAGGVVISASLQSGLQFSAANGTGGYYLGRAYGSDDANDFFLYDVTNGKRRFGVTTTGDSFFENSNVGIGTTTPTQGRLHVEGSGATAVYGHSSDDGFGVFGSSDIGDGVFGRSTSGIGVQGVSDSRWGVSGSSVSSSGVAGTSSSGYGVSGFSVNGYGVYGQSSTNYAGFFDGAGYFGGNVHVTGNLSVVGNVCAFNLPCSSDARLKENVRSLDYGLSHLLRLRPVSWSWIDRTQTQLPIGLIAQEVEGVIPELIMRDADPAKPLGLNYFGLVPIIIKAIQEQQDTITALRQHNAAVDGRVTALEQTLQRLLGQQPGQAEPSRISDR